MNQDKKTLSLDTSRKIILKKLEIYYFLNDAADSCSPL